MEEHTKSTNRWVMLLVAFLSAFSFSFSMQSLPPLLPSLISEIRISHALAGSLMTFVALPTLFLAIPTGALVSRYGLRVFGTAGLLMVSLGALLSSLSPSLAVLQLARLTVGIGGPLVWVSALSLVTQWFSSKERGLAMGIFAMHMPAAVASAFNILGRVDASYGWLACFWISFVVSIAILLTFLLFAREKPVGAPATLSFRHLRNVRIWVLGLIWTFFGMAISSFATWGKTLFIEFKDLSPAYADFVTSLIVIAGFSAPLAGLLGDKLQRRRLLLIIGLVYMMIAFPLVPQFNGVILACFVTLLGLIATLVPPTLFVLAPAIIGPAQAPLGFGVLTTCREAAVVLGPFLVGLILDTAHNFTSVVLAMSFFLFLALPLSLLLKGR
ncbi:nitrate/nitrite transporter [Chloroflexota bacterium]